LFPVLFEPGDPPVEFGSLSLGHRNVSVVEALPKGLDQIEPLARREPGQFGCQITHGVQDGERKNARQLAFRLAVTVREPRTPAHPDPGLLRRGGGAGVAEGGDDLLREAVEVCELDVERGAEWGGAK
jgi:hypothetical protein